MSLNHAQTEAVAHNKGPCMVLAGPGSGKTLTIAKRIEYLIMKHKVRPEEILVITFTKYAAWEMKNRTRSICGPSSYAVTFGTFHGIYYGILKWAYRLNQSNLLSDEEKYRILREILPGIDWDQEPEADEEKDYLQELAIEIGNVKNNCMDIEEYEPVKYTTEKFRKLYRTYEETKKKYRKIDFEDMLIQCRDLFMKRPDILKKWQEKFQYILVDEFQDVNQAQYDVVRMLAAPQDNLFVVGDDDQSVYGFRGAKPGIMKEFMKDYPKARQILLDVNYRSSGYIVKGALRVIGNNKIRFEKKIEAFRKPDETVHVQEVKDPVQEAEYVLERIREYREKGVSYTEMAVLYRTNVDARAMSELMTEYQIPFVMKEHLNNIYEHFIALDMISYLRLSQGEYDRKYFLQIANRPNRYLTRESMKTGNVSYESLRRYYRDKDWMVDRIDQLEWDMKMICDKTPYAAIQYIRKRMGYDEFLKEYAAYRKISSEDLFAVLEEIWQNSKGYGTIKEWFEHIESYGKMLKEQNKKNGEKEGVNLMTMHAAKGLEFDTVFVIEANEGSCPYKKATANEEIEEERRLFYVAMTRAKRKLVISYVKEKNGKDLLPSRFVSELLLNV
ncbi:ATP-dependent helicase [Dorea longicatena]|jgi:DNA helicase-2/ATP-dependent DNA helicase PcrA|uniref:DNA 3'-5' helicase n=1 Tax=Dorea longicatena DSM 13814 TaxID=411462 RepID=A6BEL8_9FIRM|nr:ATP-dependent helicase [Dorea longicatena]EDM64057.1 UvrD/REP helicase [Dorea longicatena DSM 13814]MBS5434122.1 ATP-dependent helicase [Dorea longicatena]UWP23836.1 ATP-dependent helicase [Dorea longicatena]